jgi:hypothetical protein
MANNNYPSAWDSRTCFSNPDSFWSATGFAKPFTEISRWAARYRVAKSLRGLDLYESGGFKSPTQKLWNASFRIFFTYSVFEQFCDIIGIDLKQDVEDTQLRILQNRYDQSATIEKIRDEDREYAFFRFVRDNLDREGQVKRLTRFIEQEVDCNVSFLARTSRHIFAHGIMTGHSGGKDVHKKTGISAHISKSLLKVMDEEFSAKLNSESSRKLGNSQASS